MKRILIITFLFVCSYLLSVNMIINIPDTNKENLMAQGRDIACFKPDNTLDLVIDESELSTYRVVYPNLSVVTTDNELRSNLRMKTRDIPGYHDYAMLSQELYNLQIQYPTLSMLTTIGDSWGKIQYDNGNMAYSDYNHQLFAMKVSDNPEVEEDEPVIYFVAEHHAREPISLEVVLNLLNYLLENYSIDPMIQEYVDNYQIWFIPLLNPDGHKVVTDEGDIWWRKNIRDNDEDNILDLPSSYGNSTDGVDLNRNYGWHWGNLNAPDDFNYATYHGTGPFSEPETQAFRDFLESKRPLAGISYHSYGNYVLYPYGYHWNVETADRDLFIELAGDMAQLIHRTNGQPYSSFVEWQLYPCMGGTDDYAYGTYRTIALTIELADTFIPDASLVPDICSENLNGQLHFLERFSKSILRGHVTDSVTGEPLDARIFIDDLDNMGTGQSDYRTNPQWGSYYRTLFPGDYTFSVSADGYVTQRGIECTITDSTETVIDIQMIPSGECNLLIQILDENNLPVSDASVLIGHEEIETYQVDTLGNLSLNSIPAGIYKVRIDYPDYGLIDRTLEVAPGSTYWTFNLNPASTVYDFETETNDWLTNGAWGRTDSESMEGVYSLSSRAPDHFFQSNCFARLAQPIDNSNGDLSIDFYMMRDLNYPDNICYLQISENGQFWFSIDSYREDEEWTRYSYDLSQYNFTTLYLRFSQRIDSGNTDGVYIDNFSIYQNQVTVPVEENAQLPVTSKLSVYPNPFGNSINIKREGISDEEVNIYNVRGQLVKSIRTTKDNVKWDATTVNGQKACNGIYFFQSGAVRQKALLLR